jgi:hypothetical protein
MGPVPVSARAAVRESSSEAFRDRSPAAASFLEAESGPSVSRAESARAKASGREPAPVSELARVRAPARARGLETARVLGPAQDQAQPALRPAVA